MATLNDLFTDETSNPWWNPAPDQTLPTVTDTVTAPSDPGYGAPSASPLPGLPAGGGWGSSPDVYNSPADIPGTSLTDDATSRNTLSPFAGGGYTDAQPRTPTRVAPVPVPLPGATVNPAWSFLFDANNPNQYYRGWNGNIWGVNGDTGKSWPTDQQLYTRMPGPGGSPSGSSSDADIQAILNKYLNGTLTPGGLNAANAELNALGIKQQKDSAGNPRGRLFLPDGRTVDLGDFGGALQWVDRGTGWGQGDTAGGGSSGGSGGSGGGSWGGFGSLAQGWTTPFNGPSWNQSFHSPTLEELRATPGYQFALEQGLQGVQRSAAAKGTLLTGGTLKALDQYGTGLADQTYGQAWNRAMQQYMNDFSIYSTLWDQARMAYLDQYNIWRNNGNDIFGRYYNLAGLGLNAAAPF